MNAVKTGLTGRTGLLPTDDAAIYQQHLDRHSSEFSPATDRERALVQLIADAEWRLLRIHPLEASLWALGRLEFSHDFADESLLQGKIYLTYKKDFANLALQERRITNLRKNHLAELHQLQVQRLEKGAKRGFHRTPQPRIPFRLRNGIQRPPPSPSLRPVPFWVRFSLQEMRAFGVFNTAHRQVTGVDLDFPTRLAAHRVRRDGEGEPDRR
jgi:hypothetical protein